MVLLLLAAVAWWGFRLFFGERTHHYAIFGATTGYSAATLTFVSWIQLPEGATPTGVETTARELGFEVFTNATFNDLIPAERRSAEFAGTTVYRFDTANTNDVRLLAVPASGTNCYLYVCSSGDSHFMEINRIEVQQLIRRLGNF